MNADAMIGWVALIVMVLVVAVFLRARSSSKASSNTRSNRRSSADPLAEAEVYLAYGKKKEAVEVLDAALGRYPDREDIRVKLDAIRRDF